ncbi:hypothetical protein [Vibrio parahaemolyticus]|uniref:hypothetical protein n=1 Tax=Vibrio parahaemolyticus TaxID=670 RepID=UPI001D40AC60|nr:hypothetical protein [Vibrio parahaemolyticus]EHJ9995294.1 hypothetical protein [Vibrio parahaemolyticus]MCG0010467.1 hypothetical protein [Vibrio parahaemolyticus]MDL2023017.1 hypothetical protein [Vibrio parahaemolyticus]MDL2027500.1 hypothetical protein [Vibrio parahaemolyticus]
MVDENQSSNQGADEDIKTKEQGGGFLSTLATLILWLVIASTMLWNWDGFWQTDIKPLERFQKEYFSSKYNEEQLKISRITNNNKLIADIRGRLEKAEKIAEGKVEKANEEKVAALSKLDDIELQLSNYLDKENTKCRYFDTSLRMIDHLTKKYSEDELKRVLSCTSAECENILHYRQEARSICG